ncbi:hypothetical protein AAFC00_001999 [Neodothiora populina]|uniref:CAP-Gly domain-containing protein n=1 Tax=Neodothiora populina TaxID=2781224 RepID=A0ABR3PH46_9PEZI
MASLPLAAGQTVELNDGRRAVIRFLGATGFAPGEWIGVELDEPTGKNDGSVKGDRYFDCRQNYGMFLRAAGVGKILDHGRPQPGVGRAGVGNGTAANAAAKSRPNSISAAPVGRAIASHSRRESTILSPRSPTKQLGTATSSSATSRTSTPPSVSTPRARPGSTAVHKPRSSLANTPTLASGKRNSTAVSSTSAASSTAAAAASRHASRPSVSGGNGASSRAPASRAPLARPSLTPSQRTSSSRLSSLTSNASDRQASLSSQPSPLLSPAEFDEDHLMASTSIEETDEDEEDDSDEESDQDDTIHAMAPPPAPVPAPAPAPASSRTSAATSGSARAPPRRTASPPPSHRAVAKSAAVASRELEDAHSKIRVFERKRLEDREKLKKLGEMEQERDKYAAVVQKLQTKMQSQSQELAELRQQLKDSEAHSQDIEAIQAEHDAVVEMATLDREMAEETAEVLKTEVEALRSKNEEMTLELEILKEENQELGREMSPDERTGQGWLQLERSNERLREALIRLRDITQEQEADLKDQIIALEDEVKDHAAVRTDYEDMKEKLLATEADVEDLRQQLEAALGAEDIIEELTERNMSMQEDMEEMRAIIEDLESLKELNDELEVNHVEAEKQMQEEIDYKDTLINENLRRSAQQLQTIEDCEYTISRFRDLVTTMQTDLEDMRASQQITDKEAEDLSNRSRTMLDLNMKLQISASKTQVKTIDLELRRLEAEEAAEHLSIVQLFLPEAFNADRDSVLALLRFKRLGFKANLIHTFVKERITSQNVDVADTSVFAACGVMDRLAWISAMAERFVHSIGGCSVEDFAKYEGALYELEPVERALNNYISALKRQELDEPKVDEELQRSMAVMSHLASIHIRESSATFTDEVLMQTSLIQSHLETTASAFALCRSFIETHVSGLDEESSEDESTEPSLTEKLDAFVSQSRSAKVVMGKTHRALSELQTRSLALSPSSLEKFVAAEQVSQTLCSFARRAGEHLQTLFGEEGRDEPFTPAEISLALSRLSATAYNLSTPEASPMVTVATSLRSLTEALAKLNALPADLDNVTEFERSQAPWILRSSELRAAKLTSADTEAEVARLTGIVRDRSLLVRAKEQELEEQGVRIEMLEARMTEAQKRSARLAEAESALDEVRTTEAEIRKELETAKSELEQLRVERDEWARQKSQLSQQQGEMMLQASQRNGGRGRGMTTGAGNSLFDAGDAASRFELEASRAREKNLQAAVRYLQRQRRALPSSTQQQAQPLHDELNDDDRSWLESEPLLSSTSPHQQQTEQTPKARLTLLQQETKSLSSSLLQAIVNTKLPTLTLSSKSDRLAWKPARETLKWKTARRREEWEGWKEWVSDLEARAAEESVDGERQRLGSKSRLSGSGYDKMTKRGLGAFEVATKNGGLDGEMNAFEGDQDGIIVVDES